MGRRSKVVKPTAAEQRVIDARLKKSYPVMYEPVIPPGTKKQLRKVRGADRKALMRMVATKLKKLYKARPKWWQRKVKSGRKK